MRGFRVCSLLLCVLSTAYCVLGYAADPRVTVLVGGAEPWPSLPAASPPTVAELVREYAQAVPDAERLRRGSGLAANYRGVAARVGVDLRTWDEILGELRRQNAATLGGQADAWRPLFCSLDDMLENILRGRPTMPPEEVRDVLTGIASGLVRSMPSRPESEVPPARGSGRFAMGPICTRSPPQSGYYLPPVAAWPTYQPAAAGTTIGPASPERILSTRPAASRSAVLPPAVRPAGPGFFGRPSCRGGVCSGGG